MFPSDRLVKLVSLPRLLAMHTASMLLRLHVDSLAFSSTGSPVIRQAMVHAVKMTTTRPYMRVDNDGIFDNEYAKDTVPCLSIRL